MDNGFIIMKVEILTEIGSFLSGLKHELWGRFYESGELKQEEKYSYGKLLNVSSFNLLDGNKIETQLCRWKWQL